MSANLPSSKEQLASPMLVKSFRIPSRILSFSLAYSLHEVPAGKERILSTASAAVTGPSNASAEPKQVDVKGRRGKTRCAPSS